MTGSETNRLGNLWGSVRERLGVRWLAAIAVLVVAVVVAVIVLGGSSDSYVDFGGSLSDEPVGNLAGGISEEAHNELVACGYSDADAEDLPSSADGVVTRFDASGQEVGRLKVDEIAPGIFLYDCLD